MSANIKYLLITALLLASAACSAQCPSNKRQFELTGSYGLMPAYELADRATANENAAAGRGGKSQTYNQGNLFITARYFLYNRLALGVTAGVTNERGQYTDKHDPMLITSTYTKSITTIAPELYYIYFFRKYLEVYTLFGIGPGSYTTTTTTNETPYVPRTETVEKHNALRIQYTPIGIRFGGRIGGFAELGVGYKGLVNAGLSVKLGPSCWWRG